MQSILSRIEPDQVDVSPFPHVVVQNAIEAEHADRLLREFPPLELFTKGQNTAANKKIYYTAARALTDEKLTEAWTNAVKVHSQPSEWREALRIFAPHLDREHPGIRQILGDLENLSVGIRSMEDFSKCDVLIDCKAVIHTPFSGPPLIERGPHLKSFRTLFVWYLYLRAQDDLSTGADHVLYRVKPSAKIALNARQTADAEAIELTKTIPYRQNTFVLFMNTPRSFQTNSPRTESNIPLMALHGSFYLRERLFEVLLKPNVSAIDFVKPQRLRPTAGWLRSLFDRLP
jgi:hypothetical protein